MTATSHAITGGAVGLLIGQPWLALPVALLSHFVCDMLPHIGVKAPGIEGSNKRLVLRIYIIDLIFLITFLSISIIQYQSLIILGCIILACSPDLAWFYRIIIQEKFGKVKPRPMNWFNQWHVRIQWSETLRFGVPFELAYVAIIMLYVYF